MTNAMSAELYWLAWTTVFTGLLWLPYILQIIRKIGVNTALSETGGVEPHHSWSVRAKKAHANAVENLMIFAPLALAVAEDAATAPLEDLGSASFGADLSAAEHETLEVRIFRS